jgi:hypothetical protein
MRSGRRIVCFAGLTLLLLLFSARLPAVPPVAAQEPLAPTYRIFATREGLVGYTTANGHVIRPRDRFVALPCRCALSSYLGNEFQVRITYKGRSVIAPVWDIGPWNTRDDYWADNRRYGDLPKGMPMAQAAKLHGYNSGRDEQGRVILLPNGIDIADGTFWDDLQMIDNDWVEVSFLWLGRDPGPGTGATEIIPGPVPDTPAPAPPAEPVVNIEPLAGAAMTIDDSHNQFTANDGPWFQKTCGVSGSHNWTYSTADPAKSANLASWQAPELEPGVYEVHAYIPRCGEASATSGARYRIAHADGLAEVTVDQAAAAGNWVALGRYRYETAGAARVELSDLAGDARRAVRYDAIAWTRQTDQQPPDATIRFLQRDGLGLMVGWDGTDDVSGIASYDVQVRQLPDGGWRSWKTGVSITAAWFGPTEGRDYAFRIRARDREGREEAWPESADLDTTCAGARPDQTCAP